MGGVIAALLILSPAFAQESTPEPVPTEPIPTFTETPTLTPSPTWTPTASETPPLMPPPPTVEATAEITPEITSEPTPIWTAHPTLIPNLPVIYTENFETDDRFVSWLTPIDQLIASNGQNQALYLSGVNRLTLDFSYVADVIVQGDFALQAGALRIGVRNSAAGSYFVTLSANGDVTLNRSDTVIASTTIGVLAPTTWITVRLSVIGDTLTVHMNDVQLIQVVDSQPLEHGTIYFATDTTGTSAYFLDNFLLQGTFVDPPTPDSVPLGTLNAATAADQSPTRKIAYSATTGPYDFDRNIYTINPDGTQNTLIINHPSSDTEPTWSPDGTKLAFVTDRTGGIEIWIHHLTTGVPTPLTQGRSPAWSPDGRYIAFTRPTNPSTASSTLMIIDTITGAITSYPTTAPRAQVPSWSPDMTRIALQMVITRTVNQQVIEENGVHLVTLATGATTFFVDWAYNPTWSPDGRYVGFTRKEFTHNGVFRPYRTHLNQLNVVNVANRTKEMIGQRNANTYTYLDWSPDGSQIVSQINLALYLVDVEGDQIDTLLPNTAYSPIHAEWGPDFSFTGCPGYDGVTGNSVPDEICQVFATNTPRSNLLLTNTPEPTRVQFLTNTPQGGATNTPTPTPTPSISPTPGPTQVVATWRALATDFPLPLVTTPLARLSDPEYVDRAYPPPGSPTPNPTFVQPLCSRDVNRPGGGANFPAIASAGGHVMIVDLATSGTDNENLGNFVVIRIPVQGLPQSIKQSLVTNLNQNPANANIVTLINQNVGWIWMGYAHLSSVNIPGWTPSNYPPVSANTQLGLSGNTGLQFPAPLVAGLSHLDISAYYISGEIVEPLRSQLPDPISGTVAIRNPTTIVYGSGWAEPYNIYSGFFVWRDYGLVSLIDPLWLWPLLQDGANFANGIDYQCP